MRFIHSLLAICCISLFYSCNRSDTIQIVPSQIQIIPQPNSIQFQSEQAEFLLKQNATVFFDSQAESLSELFFDYYPKYSKGKSTAPIRFVLDPDLNSDSYNLTINENGIELVGGNESALFYGFQTLKQIIPESTAPVHYLLPQLSITDAPSNSYRGMHLDVSRHMVSVDAIKKYIDWLAFYKFNRFHWHLTDDQGWRIEIKQFPKLQEIAAYRPETLVGKYGGNPKFDGKRYGGYYTQEQAREIVQYATKRHITVIPEIELPGHAQAAIAAYPELGCTDSLVDVRTYWGVSEFIYCPKEETFSFLEQVLTEVMQIFPSEYIHIGGDEAPKKQWEESAIAQEVIKNNDLNDEHELQSYFIQRIEKFLNQNGRKIIGWDEILEGGLAPNATVMSWRGSAGATEAAQQNHQAILTPTEYCYFDYYQSKDEKEPLAIGGYLPLEKVYALNPKLNDLSEKEQSYILGVQANVWTEYITTERHLDYMIFPRLLAMSEVAWTAPEHKDYTQFLPRAQSHVKMLQSKGLNPATHCLNQEKPIVN